MKRFLMVAGLVTSAISLQGCFPIAAVGVGATALVVDDRRSTGFYVEDENIEWKARSILIDRFKDTHVNVTSFNLGVLLTGEVSDEKMKADIAEAIRKVGSVKNVTNELTVGGKSSLAARSNDALITTNVKARFIGAGNLYTPTAQPKLDGRFQALLLEDARQLANFAFSKRLRHPPFKRAHHTANDRQLFIKLPCRIPIIAVRQGATVSRKSNQRRTVNGAL